MSPTIRLTSSSSRGDAIESVVVDVDVERGGRIAQITVGDIPLLVDVPLPKQTVESTGWGSYPMAPWAGRVRAGRFDYFDTDHQLFLNQDDSGSGAPGRQHAMHGTVFEAAWTVNDRQADMLEMSCLLDQPGSGWPFGGIAHQRIEVSAHQLRCDLSIHLESGHLSRQEDGQRDDQQNDQQNSQSTPASFPAVIGWHPWWRKPDALTFHPDAMYERDDVGLPTGRLVAPTSGPWDDCFVNTAPVTLHYDRTSVRDVTVSSDCDHWVIYDEQARATCVEPQSGPPDAFNLRPQIVTGTHPLRRTMTIGW